MQQDIRESMYVQWKYPLFARVTTQTPLEEMFNQIKEKYPKLIISKEEAASDHYHILVYSDDENVKNRRQNFRNFIKKLTDKGGNAGYAITETKEGTEKRLEQYVLKDGLFKSQGFLDDYIKQRLLLSYKKYSKDEFGDKFNSILEDYLTDKIDDYEFMDQWMKLKISFNQVLNKAGMQSLFRMYYCKKNGTYKLAKQFVDDALKDY